MKWQKTKKKSLSDESLNKGKPKNENPKDNKCINTKIGKIKKQSESEEGQALNLKKKNWNRFRNNDRRYLYHKLGIILKQLHQISKKKEVLMIPMKKKKKKN